MRLWVTLAAMVGVVAGVAASAPAQAQVESREGIALQNQILELRRDVQNLRDGGGRSTAPSGSALGNRPSGAPAGAPANDISASLLDRVLRLEDDMRQLNGRIDELNNAQQRQSADLSKQIADLQFRLDNSPAAGGRAPAAVPTPPQGPANLAAGNQAPANLGTIPAGDAPPLKRTPDQILQEGNAALARRDYAGAEAAARQVLASSKGTPNSYSAQFLLAQSLAGEKDYNNAALAYNDAYVRNKQGARAQDSLLGLASSLLAINQKPAACGALDTLRGQFPTPRPEIAARAASLRASSGCRP